MRFWRIDMYRPIFGNDNAENDALLYDCEIERKSPEYLRPILTGRWGSGKTAILLLQNQELTRWLERTNKDSKLIWYLHEGTLDINALMGLSSTLNHEERLIRRQLESLWTAEILRVYCQMLSLLVKNFRNTSGDHWKLVISTSKTGGIFKAVWKQIPQAVSIWKGNTDIGKAATTIQNSMGNLFRDELFQAVRNCLVDIENQNLNLTVAIEPIETPTSDLEDNPSLAQILIASLLNAYRGKFEPSIENPFNLRITIPWHRFTTSALDFPQKLLQYKGSVEWGRDELRAFINRRIDWEFRRVGRKYSHKGGNDAWSELFPKTIRNGICRVEEDSFDYFLRHTHHRARDLQRLAREVVEAQARAFRVQVDDVILGKTTKDKRLVPEIVKDAFRFQGPQLTDLLIVEAERRYPEIRIIVDQMYGMTIPFNESDLKKRLQSTSVDLNRAMECLWDSGILGVSLVPETTKASKKIANIFPHQGVRKYHTDNNGSKYERWSWYEYNWNGNAVEILDKLRRIEQAEPGLVIHPITFEYLAPKYIDPRCPIGI